MDTTISKEVISLLNDIANGSIQTPNESMTVEEAARFLRVGKSQIYAYAKAGLPYFEMGNKMLFLMTDLIVWRENFRKVAA